MILFTSRNRALQELGLAVVALSEDNWGDTSWSLAQTFLVSSALEALKTMGERNDGAALRRLKVELESTGAVRAGDL